MHLLKKYSYKATIAIALCQGSVKLTFIVAFLPTLGSEKLDTFINTLTASHPPSCPSTPYPAGQHILIKPHWLIGR